jgi:hypothetical protein
MDSVLVKWDGSRGGSERTKRINSDRLSEYLSYGWYVVGEKIESVEPAPAPVMREPEPIKPVIVQDVKRRGRPSKRY